jgi:kynurenine formamidase
MDRALRHIAFASLLVLLLVAPAARAEPSGWPFKHMVDLTHTLDSSFPYIPIPGLTFPFRSEPIATLDQHGVAANKWTIHEHLGTQIDAPNHFIENGRSLDKIRLDELTAPLAVIDIRAKAAANPDAVLTVDDVLAWEKRYGRLPDGACVVMHSGWGKFVTDSKRYIGQDKHGVKHFPGIAKETAEFLVRHRKIWGVGVDVVSFDPGVDNTYQTHRVLLGADKLALEAMANLDKIPASGATLIVGAIKVRGATGGPVRLIAVW